MPGAEARPNRSVLAPSRSAIHLCRVPETLNPARRWNSFVCPGCRFVFRVSQDHDGKGVVCPACRIMLRLPAPDDETPPLLTPPSGGESGELEEIEAGGDDDHSHDPGNGNLKFFLSLAVPALVLLGLFAWWMAPDPAKPVLAGPLPADLQEVPADPVPPSAAAKSLVLEIESVVKSFLTAPSVDEALRHVRDPGKTAPKVNDWLAGKSYAAPGFRELVGDSVSNNDTTGEVFTVNVRTGDFELREIVVIGTEGNLKVDWESWVGWSEMPWEEFQNKRPVEGKWFRVELSRVQYYNFDFKDEKEWVSYRLVSPDGVASLYGYVPRVSPLDEKIRPVDQNGKEKLLLKLRFPTGSSSNNQVIIEAVSGQSWVELPGSESP
jgi:hypothetical protein